MNEIERRKACEIVERMARGCGRDCEIIFGDDFVQVAPLADAGDTTSGSLYDALTEALGDNPESPQTVENKQLRGTIARLQALCGEAHSELDKFMGDSDLPNDESPLMDLMQRLAMAKEEPL